MTAFNSQAQPHATGFAHPESPRPKSAGAVLTIDLAAIQANWCRLRDRLMRPASCAAVVKADAYGTGVDRVGPALAQVGCRRFFVAYIDEAIQLRRLLPRVEIYVLNGLMPGTEDAFLAHRIVPVLNDLGEIDAWAAQARKASKALAAILHIDTGMSRLGLDAAGLTAVARDPVRLTGINLHYVMSHLACADEPAHPMNEAQREAFAAVRARLPQAPASLANSAATLLLDQRFHLDLARPGIALHGVGPNPSHSGALRRMGFQQSVRLDGTILQVRSIAQGDTVGYGALWRASGPRRIATVAVGYADGYFRAFTERSAGMIGGRMVQMVGRVSMDLITFDVTDVPETMAHPGASVALIDSSLPIDGLAQSANMIGYELLTNLGRRYHRVYVGG